MTVIVSGNDTITVSLTINEWATVANRLSRMDGFDALPFDSNEKITFDAVANFVDLFVWEKDRSVPVAMTLPAFAFDLITKED